MAVYRQSRRGARRVSLKRSRKFTSRRVKSSRGSTFALSTWARPEAGLPDKTVVKMRYIDTITLTSALGAVTANTFRMNSIFDPDNTGVGHQPLYHDTWGTLYNRYVVKKSTIKAIFSNNDVTAAANWHVGIISDNNTTISATPSTNQEPSNAPWKILTPSGGSKDQLTVYGVPFTPKLRLGLPATDSTVGAAFGSNPASVWFATVWGSNISGSASSSITFDVVIDYWVELSQMITQAQS